MSSERLSRLYQPQDRRDDAGNFPKVILIDTISVCNLQCTMCFHRNMTRSQGTMSWKVFTKIIDEIAEVDKNVRVWMVFFGEALILKKRPPTIFDMIAYAKQHGLTDVVLNSNGTLLDEDAAKGLIHAGLDAIYVGIDAFNPDTYEALRVGGDYNKTVQNILNMLQLKRSLKAGKPEVFVQFVEMESNAHEKEAFLEFWQTQGATVKIRPMVSWAGLIEAPNLILKNEERCPCYWAMRTMSITDTGKVVTCAADVDAQFVAGDVNEASLQAIWNGQLKELRQYHLSGQFDKLPPNCRYCRDWQAARANFYSQNT